MQATENYIDFPYYHHVLDDERRGFERQLKYMRRFGEFLSLDEALEAMRSPAGIDGRYFCVTFDDGFKNCLTNALPILLDNNCPAAFYVPTDYVGLDLDADRDLVQRFYDGARSYTLPIEFLNWDDCRALAAAGMTIGSHTCSHTRLTGLSSETLARELHHSKARIESELGKPCSHFACPWGRPGRDFDAAEHIPFVRDAGYRSMLTTQRGANRAGTDPFAVMRQEFRAHEGLSVLRYMFARRG
jgi:peptidoglycan/xylan/chitin deacetylase (PgdA/CDA1 family)